MVYDISNPFEPFFVDYVNTSPIDIAPEGLVFIKEDESPNGKALIVVSHEVSNTTSIFEINKGLSKMSAALSTQEKRRDDSAIDRRQP
jgi:hypothetical protein